MADRRALICEDDQAIRTLVRTIVAREGFKVDTAENGREGIEKLETDCYELVVLDLMMPEVDGFAVVKFLKERTGNALKRVIVMTAATEVLRHQFPEPVCTVLSKPFSIDSLSSAVRSCARACGT